MKNQILCVDSHPTKVNLDNLKLYIYWIVLFPPPIFERLGFGFNQILLCSQFVLVTILLIQLFAKNKICIQVNEIYWFILISWGFLVTIIQCREYLYQYMAAIVFPIVSVFVLFQVLYQYNEGVLIALSSMASYFSFMVWSNFFMMIIFSKGVIVSDYMSVTPRATWLFGSKNNITFCAILIITILILHYRLNKKKSAIVTCFLLVLEAICSGSDGVDFLEGSTTGVIIYISFFVILILLTNNKLRRISINNVTNRRVLYFSIIITLIVWTISLNGSSLISGFLLLFGKDVGFSFRNLVWNDLLNAIKNTPLYGHGYNLDKNFYAYYLYTAATYSFWGGSLYYFGVIGTIFYFNCLKVPSNIKMTEETLIVVIGIMFYLILGLMNDLNVKYLITLMELECLVYRCKLSDLSELR